MTQSFQDLVPLGLARTPSFEFSGIIGAREDTVISPLGNRRTRDD